VPLSLANPVLLDVWTYWRGICAGRRAPLFSDIDLESLGRLAHNVLIVERDETGRFRYGAVGSSIQTIYGYPMEGMYLDIALPPDRRKPAITRYTLACETGQPLLARSAYTVSVKLGFFVDRIILPLARADGSIGGALSGQLMRPTMQGTPLADGPAGPQPDEEQIVFLDDAGQAVPPGLRSR
jgi:hypothetical protein